MKPKFFRTSLIAGLFTALIIAIPSGYIALSGPDILADGSVDNDPMRAGMMILYILPIIYIIIVFAYYAIARLLFSFGKLNLMYLIIIAVVASMIAGYSLESNNIKGFLSGFLVFTIVFSSGAISWWYFGLLKQEDNKRH
jgi:hypothetical protein